MNNHIPAVEKTVELMEYLTAAGKGVSQAQLKKDLGISMSTAYRILQTLLAKNWIRKDGGLYYPGGGLLPVLAGFHSGIHMIDGFHELLDSVAREYEVACKLSVRQGNEQVTLFRSEPEGPVVLTGKKFARFPVIEGSVGASLLADETEENIRLLSENCQTEIPEKYAPDLILQSIAFLRKHGYVFNENNRWNICAVSAPVRESSGAVFAVLTFVLPHIHLTPPEMKKRVRQLKYAAGLCSRLLDNENKRSITTT